MKAFSLLASENTHKQQLRMRAVWIVLSILGVLIYISSLPDYFIYLQVHEHASPLLFTYLVGFDFLTVFGCLTVTGLLFFLRSDDTIALFIGCVIILFGIATVRPINLLPWNDPILYYSLCCLKSIEQVLAVVACYIFPDGRFIPRWTTFLVCVWGSINILWLAIPRLEIGHVWLNGIHPQYPYASASLATLLLALIVYSTGVYAQFYRYRHSSGLVRQQAKWITFGVSGALVGYLVSRVYLTVGLPISIYYFYIVPLSCFSTLLVPFSLGIAILRYKLWKIDALINRALVYFVLTFVVFSIYVCVIFLSSFVLKHLTGDFLHQSSLNDLITFTIIGFITLLLRPLHRRIQHSVNRLMYGERDNPHIVVRRLEQTLAKMQTPQVLLATVTSTLAHSLRLPYVAIILDQDKMPGANYIYGEPIERPLIFPLLDQQDECLGHFIVAPRFSTDSFAANDVQMLKSIAHHLAMALQAVRLTTELQRSRQQIADTREQERIQLRKNFHDHLSPTLAHVSQCVDRISFQVRDNPESVLLLVSEAKEYLREATDRMRHVLDGLRPPILDTLGLVDAIREFEYGDFEQDQEGMATLHICVQVDSPEPFPPISPATEAAAYQIVKEALTNVRRHSEAHLCVIRISCDDALRLEITDDGKGLPLTKPKGVGLLSMRERAKELGGDCVIENRHSTGVCVKVRLPIIHKEK